MKILTKFQAIKLLDQQGFTMVEVLISMAIIALLAMTFIPLFSTSFINIFAFGERDRAMSAASDVMEHLYAAQPFEDRDSIETKLNGLLTSAERNFSEFILKELDTEEHYQIEPSNDPKEIDSVKGYRVSLDAYYQSGGRRVTLTSFIRVN
ncbi:type IV pilus modification PilV family protein [Natranaerobius trueperi]|uniref:Prepilin-type cleavage/methylation domain-containing protein n=1 Tax=Natranaerobius trueperi TaxID=759412 RepID=A0A226C078_9FIRM|nr:type II secretion system protein [Natranaerobius trueperi]OWZ84636.1 hypothetical protein CDO51_02425 [Natranaerobius trueperi]